MAPEIVGLLAVGGVVAVLALAGWLHYTGRSARDGDVLALEVQLDEQRRLNVELKAQLQHERALARSRARSRAEDVERDRALGSVAGGDDPGGQFDELLQHHPAARPDPAADDPVDGAVGGDAAPVEG